MQSKHSKSETSGDGAAEPINESFCACVAGVGGVVGAAEFRWRMAESQQPTSVFRRLPYSTFCRLQLRRCSAGTWSSLQIVTTWENVEICTGLTHTFTLLPDPRVTNVFEVAILPLTIGELGYSSITAMKQAFSLTQ
jgi:hypothetical protein